MTSHIFPENLTTTNDVVRTKVLRSYATVKEILSDLTNGAI